MRLISSELALRLVLALRQAGIASLAHLAEVVGFRPSSCQRALEVLLDDGFAVTAGSGRARDYRLNDQHLALHAVEDLARASLPTRETLALTGRANPAVELVALSSERLLIVFTKRSLRSDRSIAAEAINRLADAAKLQTQFLGRDDLAGSRDLSERLRREFEHADVLVGQLDHSIPDPHRRTAGRPLGHVNAALRLPSNRTMQALKRRHGVRRLRIFGSAVRSDFRPDSDVDIVVSLDPTRRSDPEGLEMLEVELEKRLGREVDLTLESQLRPPVRYMVDRESLTL